MSIRQKFRENNTIYDQRLNDTGPPVFRGSPECTAPGSCSLIVLLNRIDFERYNEQFCAFRLSIFSVSIALQSESRVPGPYVVNSNPSINEVVLRFVPTTQDWKTRPDEDLLHFPKPTDSHPLA